MQTAAIVGGTHVAPRDRQITVEQWCRTWLEGYVINRESSARAVGFHVEAIKAAFGEMPLTALRPSAIKTWVAQLRASGASDHYTYTLHSRLSQILSDAVHDGLLGRNPCSRRTSPPRGKQKPYVASTGQVWVLHDVMPEHLQAAVLLGAFAGLRISETCGLRVDDVDFTRGVVHPHQQYGGAPLKTVGSEAPIPIPRELTLMLAGSVQRYPSEWMVTNGAGESCPPRAIEPAVQTARAKVDGLPAVFTFHDLRHYLASLLIASGADIKTVQARLRHAAAATTLDTYGHLWPDADESTRAAVAAAIRTRIGTAADVLRTN